MVSAWQHWKRWRDFVLPRSLDHKNDNKTQNREKQKDKLIKSLSSLGWTDANVKENSVCPWRDETVCGVNNFDPRSSPPYLNQISVFISLDARIDLKIHKKKSKTFQPKLYITTTLKTHMHKHYNSIQQQTVATLSVLQRVFKFKTCHSESFLLCGTWWRGFSVWNLKHSKGDYFVVYKLQEIGGTRQRKMAPTETDSLFF